MLTLIFLSKSTFSLLNKLLQILGPKQLELILRLMEMQLNLVLMMAPILMAPIIVAEPTMVVALTPIMVVAQTPTMVVALAPTMMVALTLATRDRL